ncbi:endonuclease-reverse transcriptase [Lasius niger]|uniref:Endonuclease-reverse transcriptase n=1 Tax=Lasius niger TaxID=67767 RepID=A0A0J7K2D1_LASNI|nr:endonuclease-reverse transcriptase [Lasius niger]
MNPGKFTDEDFIDFDETLIEESATPINQVVERQNIEEAIPSTSFASLTTTSMVMNADAESSNVVVHENPINRSENQANVESFSSLLNNLSPLPSIQKNKGIGRGRKGPQKQHSEIFTATPLKVIFEEKAKKRNEKILKGKENKKKDK